MSHIISKSGMCRVLWVLLVVVMSTVRVFADDKVYPEKPYPPRLVNDYAHLLNSGQEAELERKLVQYSQTTSCQVSIVTVPSTQGHDINEYSVHIFNDWGLGEKGKDNGVLILVALDNGSGKKGTFITVGKGLQGVLTDAKCGRIVRNEMIPHFKENDYYAGLNAAADAVIAVTKDEYKGDGLQPRKHIPIGAIILAILFFLFIFSRRNRGGGGNYMSGGGFGDIATGMLLGSMFGGRRGGGDDGGGFGGFGGFGGGSTDGGGAGGSW